MSDTADPTPAEAPAAEAKPKPKAKRSKKPTPAVWKRPSLARIKKLFTWQKPSPAKITKYGSIKGKWNLVWVALGSNGDYQSVNGACSQLVTSMCYLAPESGDLSAAIRHVRLARNAFNAQAHLTEKVRAGGQLTDDEAFQVAYGVRMAKEDLLRAKWSVNAAIALNGIG